VCPSRDITLTPRGRLIQIDAEPRVLESNVPALGIRADAKVALEFLSNALTNAGQDATAGT
jgi:acetolactate synthase-1/2/3 large subunit